MDINYLAQRERVERTRASEAVNENVRAVHRELADSYRALIDAYHRNRLAAVG